MKTKHVNEDQRKINYKPLRIMDFCRYDLAMFSQIVYLSMVGVCLGSHQLRVHNRCSQEVWVGLLGNSIPDNGKAVFVYPLCVCVCVCLFCIEYNS